MERNEAEHVYDDERRQDQQDREPSVHSSDSGEESDEDGDGNEDGKLMANQRQLRDNATDGIAQSIERELFDDGNGGHEDLLDDLANAAILTAPEVQAGFEEVFGPMPGMPPMQMPQVPAGRDQWEAANERRGREYKRRRVDRERKKERP